MNSTRSPLQWRVLTGGIVGLVGVGVIGAALAFPTVTTPEAQPAAVVSVTPDESIVASRSEPPRGAEPAPVEPVVSVTPSASVIDLAAPQASTSPSPSPSSADPEPSVVGLPESEPVRVRIPSIGVDASTTELGLDGNRLAAPEDPDVVGWFTGAHTPGAAGRAVLNGHLTWNGRNTVFARLPNVAVGAVVEVDRRDGTTARFEITEVATFEKDQFPTAEVYAATEEPTMVLITCGGEYSQSEHYYDSNVIAFATAL